MDEMGVRPCLEKRHGFEEAAAAANVCTDLRSGALPQGSETARSEQQTKERYRSHPMGPSAHQRFGRQGLIAGTQGCHPLYPGLCCTLQRRPGTYRQFSETDHASFPSRKYGSCYTSSLMKENTGTSAAGSSIPGGNYRNVAMLLRHPSTSLRVTYFSTFLHVAE